MFTFTATPIAEGITCITDPSDVYSYLVCGETSALLIDTGTGFLGLDAFVRSLTDLPVQVLLTHGHGDHCGGASLFDRVWVAPCDAPMAAHSLAMRIGYANAMASEPVPAEALAPDRTAFFMPLTPGQVFDLGGLTVEAVAVPGHTRGMTCALIREHRMILFGDACNNNTLIFSEQATTLTQYRASLVALKSREGEYDTVLLSHGPKVVAKSCLDDNLALCDRILAREDDAIPVTFFGMEGLRAAACTERMERLDGAFGNIVYDPDRL